MISFFYMFYEGGGGVTDRMDVFRPPPAAIYFFSVCLPALCRGLRVQVQLEGEIDLSLGVDMYNIDLFGGYPSFLSRRSTDCCISVVISVAAAVVAVGV